MSVSFTYPLAALLLLALPVLWFWPARPRTVWHGVIRTLLFLLLIVALMQPVTVLEIDQERHVVVLDESASVPPSARALAAEAATGLVSQLADRGEAMMIRLGAPDDGQAVAGDTAARQLCGPIPRTHRRCPRPWRWRRNPSPGRSRAP